MPVITRIMEIEPVGDREERLRCYKWINDFRNTQYKIMNQYMSALYIAAVKEISQEDRKELNRLYARIATSDKGSAYDKNDCTLPSGLGVNVRPRVTKDYVKALKDGLLYGKVSLPTYKKNQPIILSKDFIGLKDEIHEKYNANRGFYHEYESYDVLCNELKEGNPKIFWGFCNKMIFQIKFGNPHKSAFFRDEILHIFEGTYKCTRAELLINKKGKILLRVILDVPQKEVMLNEDVVVGVHLGFIHPIICAVNNNYYKKEICCDQNTILEKSLELQNQIKKLQKNLKYATGGHGRNEKLKRLDRLNDYKKRFYYTINQKLSRSIIDFALKNNAKYINMANLSETPDEKRRGMKKYGYFELQQLIKYKAKLYGIIIREVNPKLIYKTCSCCGKIGRRIDEETFICLDPDCISHTKYEKPRKNGYGNYIFDAEFNIARNIALSEDFKKRKTVSEN